MLFRKNVFSNKVNKLRRCHNPVNGREPWGNFHLHICIYITYLTKIPTWKLFTLTAMEKSKAEKSPWVKKKKKPAQRRKKKLHFVKQIVDRDELNRQLAGRATCSFCQSEGLNFEEVSRAGLGAEWICHCGNPKCPSHEFMTPFHTIPLLGMHIPHLLDQLLFSERKSAKQLFL